MSFLSKKQMYGLIYQEVMLPPMAPAEWKNREQLWNALEDAEKTKDSRLAREFVIALPIEPDTSINTSILQDFIQKNFVDMGICADFAIHDTEIRALLNSRQSTKAITLTEDISSNR